MIHSRLKSAAMLSKFGVDWVTCIGLYKLAQNRAKRSGSHATVFGIIIAKLVIDGGWDGKLDAILRPFINKSLLHGNEKTKNRDVLK
jgi:hypothetical protein